MSDFVRAAAPWVAMGLCAAVLAVRGAMHKETKEKQSGDSAAEGMCLGMLTGLSAGMCIPKKSGGADR